MLGERADPLPLPALAARAQLGDSAALEELLRRLQQPLADHVRALIRDDGAAEDVLQDALLIVARKLGTVREVQWVRAWAYRVATREALRALRRSHREHTEPLDDASLAASPVPEDSGVDHELLAALPTKLAAVPFGAQIMLRMHYLQGLSQQEVAEALEMPIGTVKSRIAYGLQCLRKADWRQ